MDATSSPKPVRKPRAWWQYVIAITLFGTAGYMLVQRAILTWWPTLAYKSVPPITIKMPPNLVAADKLPTPPGSLAGANVVLVTLDTTRADRLGCYGNQHIRTPNLDDLAARGVLFKHALAPNPTTLPSHASILTGLYPFHHGARANGIFQLADKQTTLAELLSHAGYATAAFLSATVLDSRYGLAQGFGDYDDDMSEGRELLWLGGLERTGDKTTDHALKWLRGNADQKFFMWVHLYDPHSPTTPPEPYASEYAELPYDGEIAFVDEQVGRLLFELDKLGMTDNTLVVVVGDHGEGLGQHKEWSHGFMLYDATLQVPMIMACGSRMKGVHIDQTVSSADVTPTVLSLLGLDVPNGLDGVDLASGVPSERALYFDNLEGLSEWGLAPLLGVYVAPFKYIWGPQPELYDLSTDPFETHDVIQAQAQTATQLKTRLEGFFGNDLAAAAFAAPTQQLSSEELHKLQALGYAGTGLGNQPPTTPLPDPKTHMDLVLRVEMALMKGDEGDPAGAAASLEKLAAKHPDILAVYRNLGDVYRQMGEYEKARQAYEHCRQIRPDLPLPRWQVAQMLVRLGKLDEAVDAYQQALALAPQHIGILSELGGLYLRLKKFDEAAKVFKTIYDMTPSNDDAVQGMVVAYSQLGRIDEITALLEERLEAQPRLLAVRNSLAELRVSQGDAAGAVALLREGIELFPDRIELINNLGYILATSTDPKVFAPQQAIPLLERACQRTKYENYRLLYTLSEAVRRMNRVDEALGYARKALELAQQAGDKRIAASLMREIALIEQAKQKGVTAMMRPAPPGTLTTQPTDLSATTQPATSQPTQGEPANAAP